MTAAQQTTPTRLHDAIAYLGPLTTPEAKRVLRCSARSVTRMMVGQPLVRIGGRIAIGQPSRVRPSVAAVRALLDGGDVYADWLSERTGYTKPSVCDALHELGYVASMGRGAVWRLGGCEAAK